MGVKGMTRAYPLRAEFGIDPRVLPRSADAAGGAILVLIALLLLAACGNKGDLVKPSAAPTGHASAASQG